MKDEPGRGLRANRRQLRELIDEALDRSRDNVQMPLQPFI